MSIENEVIDIVVEQLGVDRADVNLSKSFLEDLNADSLDIIELTLRFEEAFKIDMADEASLELKTVRDMFNYVKDKLAAKNK